jgi:hypothetical protein
LLVYSSIISSLLPFLLFILLGKRTFDSKAHIILIYTLFSFATDVTIKLCESFQILSSNTYLNIVSTFTILEFSCFSLFFNELFKQSILSYIIKASILIYIPTSVYLLSSENHLVNNFDTIPVITQSIFFISLCIYYFFDQIRNPINLFIYDTFEFWIVASILIYFSGTFFIYLFSSNLSNNELNKYWFINYVFNLLKNILFGLAFYLNIKKNSINNIYDADLKKIN